MLLLLLRHKCGCRSSEGWSNRLLLLLLLLLKQLTMGRISRVNKGVEAITVSTGRNTAGIRNRKLLRLLPWSRKLLLRLRLRLLSLNCWLRLELSSIGVVLKVSVCWVSRVNEWVEISTWLLLLLLLRSKLLLWLWSELLLSYRSSLLLRNLLLLRLLLNRLLWLFSLSKVWIKRSTLKTISTFWDVCTFQNSKSILSS